MPILSSNDSGAVMAALKVTVPYFDLKLYGLEDYYRYHTEDGQGSYVDNVIVERPTALHLYIYLLERYYMGLPEKDCCKGTSGVLGYAEDMIEHITNQARCMVLNPKRLSVAQLTAFLYAQDELRVRYRPVPIILFSNTMTREQNREIPLPEYPVLVIDLHKRLDRNRNLAIRLLRESSLPCWQNRKTMRNNMFNDAWYLIDIETTGLDVWKDRIITIRFSKMANFEVHGESTIYIRQPEPLPENITNLTGITDDMLEHGVSLEEAIEELDALPCKSIPFVFTDEDYTTGFLNAAFLRCGKALDRPYLAIDKLANIPFGYLMQRRARNIPSLTDPESTENLLFDTELQELYALTKCTFDALMNRYDVRCPGQFDKLYAAELSDV